MKYPIYRCDGGHYLALPEADLSKIDQKVVKTLNPVFVKQLDTDSAPAGSPTKDDLEDAFKKDGYKLFKPAFQFEISG